MVERQKAKVKEKREVSDLFPRSAWECIRRGSASFKRGGAPGLAFPSGALQQAQDAAWKQDRAKRYLVRSLLYGCLLISAFCLLPSYSGAEENHPETVLPGVGEVLPIPMVDEKNDHRVGFFTVNTAHLDALLMVYSLSQSPGSYPIRLISEEVFSKRIKLPSYVKKATIPTSTVYAEYYFRNRSPGLFQFLNDPELLPVSWPHASKDFWVRRIDHPRKFIKVSADLKFKGEKCLIYKDKTLPDDLIPLEQIAAIGSKFDKEIYPTAQAYFGKESDINRDSRVTVLITGIVSNHSAFFDQKDLFPNTPYSNGQETIFLRVPLQRVPISFFTTSLAHELQHLITINQRVFLRHAYPEERWLDEGLSYMAEYLNGNQGSIAHAHNFLSAPQDFSLLYFARPYGENQGTLGAIYLFMRYLLDRYGDPILSKLTQTEKRGIANVEAATGTDFPTLYRNWVAALFLSNTGLNSDPVFNYESLNLRSLQPPVQLFRVPIRYFLNGPAEKVLDLQKSWLEPALTFEGTVEAMGVRYLRLKGLETPIQLKLIGSQESKLEAALIYLPKDYKVIPQAPQDVFEGIVLDSPLPLLYSAKKKITLRGKVLNPEIKKVGLRFEPQHGNPGQEGLTFWSPVDRSGSFRFTLKFQRKHRGDFLMGVGLFTDLPGASVKENIWARLE